MPVPPINQIALSVADLASSHSWYRAAFGLKSAGGTNSFKGFLAEKVQGLPGARSCCWWLMDGQDFFQLELFQFERPEARPKPTDWRPCDTGYNLISLVVADFDATLSRLAALGSDTVTAPMGDTGQRRVCVYDPDGTLLELLERDPATGDKLAAPATARICSITAVVEQLDQSRDFFVNTLGLRETRRTLHQPKHEALWGLAGATREQLVLESGNGITLELVKYLSLTGSPKPVDYRISDHGILNLALGFRHKEEFKQRYQASVAAGCPGNWRPLNLPNWSVVYVNDQQGFSVELLQVKPRHDRAMGFEMQENWTHITIEGKQQICIDTVLPVNHSRAWQYISKHEAMVDWWPLSEVKMARARPDTEGPGDTRFLHGFGLKLKELVTHWHPPYRYQYQLLAGAPLRQHRGTVQLVPQGETTLLIWQLEFKPVIPLTGKLCRWVLQRLLTHVTERLAKLIQAKEAANKLIEQDTI